MVLGYIAIASTQFSAIVVEHSDAENREFFRVMPLLTA
jgi:hypothetical protein